MKKVKDTISRKLDPKVYRTLQDFVDKSSPESHITCQKCDEIDKDGMYNQCVGWLCRQHFDELSYVISKFMSNS